MSLKMKLFIFMSALFLLFSTSVWVYSTVLSKQLNEKWAVRFIKKQILFDKHRTLLPIMREVALVKQMVQEPSLIAFALDETNPLTKQKALETLDQYRLKFQDRSYFAAFSATGNYYYNDANNQFKDAEFRYTLNPSKPEDSWFFYAVAQDEPYQININKDAELGLVKVWVDFLIKHEGKTVGVIGTGFDFESFLRESVGVEQEGVRNFFINKDLAVQLARDTLLIDYASLTKTDGQHKTIDLFLTHPDDVKAIKAHMKALEKAPETIQTLWVTYEGKQRLLGMAYLQELGWYSLTLIDSQELIFTHSVSMLPILSILFLLSLGAVGLALQRLVLAPLTRLKQRMQSVREGNYESDFPSIGTSEIAKLSEEFRQMLTFVEANKQALESIVRERTMGLVESEKKLNTILDTVEACIYIKDRGYRYVYANKKTCELFGKPLEAIVGQEDKLFFDEKTTKNIKMMDQRVIQYGEKVTQEEINTDAQGKVTTAFLSTKMPLLDADGSIYALCGISTDITERKKTEEIIKELAYHDPLTNLPNRRMLDERLSLLLAQSGRSEAYCALIVLDLDNFKPLNDHFGHTAGDVLLTQVASRLLACVRQNDTVARFGGDEFIVVLSELSKDYETARTIAMNVAQKILLHCSKPYRITLESEERGPVSIEHSCTASMGLTLFKGPEACRDQLFQEADKAMYDAKQNGRNRIEFFKESL